MSDLSVTLLVLLIDAWLWVVSRYGFYFYGVVQETRDCLDPPELDYLWLHEQIRAAVIVGRETVHARQGGRHRRNGTGTK